ncbi:hypothetical protein [Chlorobaculum tepidum]|nr:hypothetical protein [Chlorobaculum tepidum]
MRWLCTTPSILDAAKAGWPISWAATPDSPATVTIRQFQASTCCRKKTFDVVVNTDVLEHVPEAELDCVLRDFRKLSTNAIIIPHLAKATRILPNGENAHCTIKTPSEWAQVFKRHYAHVYELPHHSAVHALFLCGDQERDVTALRGILEQYVAAKNEVRHHLLPLGKRIEKAIRLIRGKDINR